VRRRLVFVSSNVRRDWHSIARRAVHYCASLYVCQFRLHRPALRPVSRPPRFPTLPSGPAQARKARITAHPHLTLTILYNALEKLRSGIALTDAERDIHDAGQISILRHLHDRLDEAVAAAYGWPADLPAAEIVARIVALNAQRRAEEADGLIRWLRPDFQAPEEARRTAAQPALSIEEPEAPDAIQWPRDDAASQFIALRTALARSPAPAAPRDLARRVKGAPRAAKINEMLRVLVALGQAREAGHGRFTA
jgi:hypothetical protein